MNFTLSKKFILLLLAGFSLATVNAQVQFGVKGGLNLANLAGDVSGNAILPSFHLGVQVAFPINDMLSVQPEIMYSGQGTKASGMDEKINLSYINVPVLLKYTNESGFQAETGPQIGFLLSAKDVASGTSTDIKSGFKSSDFSWAFGIGYLIKSANVGIDARYNVGLGSIAASGGGDVKNTDFQIGVFYLFGGNSK